MADFPKYQYSKFLNSQDQVVVRSDNEAEFTKMVEFVKDFGKAPTKTYKPQPTQTRQTLKAGDQCPKCGANMVLNPKTGKVFCEEKCWLKVDQVNF